MLSHSKKIISYTHKNHLQYGYGDDMQEYNPSASFRLNFGCPESIPHSPLYEGVKAAKLISQIAGRNEIHLAMSGGVDSEAMALAFLAARIPFKAAIMRLTRGLNSYDIKYAVEFCERRDIEIVYFDLDPLEIFHTELFEHYAFEYRCGYPILVCHLWLADAIPGFPVFAGNPPILRRGEAEDDYTWILPSDHYMSYHRFFSKTGKQGVGHFFLYTPELIVSFANLPINRHRLLNGINFEDPDSLYAHKIREYQQGGFDVIAKPRKYTGFENFEWWYKRNFGEPWFYKYEKKYLERHPQSIFFAPPDFQYPRFIDS